MSDEVKEVKRVLLPAESKSKVKQEVEKFYNFERNWKFSLSMCLKCIQIPSVFLSLFLPSITSSSLSNFGEFGQRTTVFK